jgi:ADP-heptose:LPS heptosyltransferase
VAEYERILVVDLLGGIGDLLMVLPAVHALARRHTGAALRVLTQEPGASLLATDPLVASVSASEDVSAELSGFDPDLVVSTTMHSGIPDLVRAHGCRAVTDLWRHPAPDERVADRYLRILRSEGLIDATHPGASPHLDASELDLGRRIVGDVTAPVVLMRDAGMAVKRWPAENWRRLADVLAVKHTVVDLPPMSLRLLAACFAAVAARGGVVVGGDTGPVRLAEAMGARVIGLFGPTTAGRYGYLSGNLQGLPGCPHRQPLAITEQPCWWTAECPLSSAGPACMAAIGVDDVLARLPDARAGIA